MKGRTGISRLLWATRHSARGLLNGARRESAIRQEMAAILLGTPLAVWLGRRPLETALLVAVLLLMLLTELLNSSVEAAIDRISPEHHELSGLAKDLGSAAVFVSILIVLVVWGAVAFARFAS